MVLARFTGSSASGGLGLPWATSQNGQRRVHRSPRIMNVAVPLPKHSPMFGQEASSHTVCNWCSRRARLTSRNFGLAAALTRIQSGFFSGAMGMILTGLRAVFCSPVWRPMLESLTAVSELCGQPGCQCFGNLSRVAFQAEFAQGGDPEPAITAWIDGVERGKVHVHVQAQAVIGATVTDAKSQRGH